MKSRDVESRKPKSILKHSSSHTTDEKRAGDSNRSAVPYQNYKGPGGQEYHSKNRFVIDFLLGSGL